MHNIPLTEQERKDKEERERQYARRIQLMERRKKMEDLFFILYLGCVGILISYAIYLALH